MELKEFLEKFLPDYEEKKQIFLNSKCGKDHRVFECEGVFYFNAAHFEEALLNYTDILCERQREICAKGYDYRRVSQDARKMHYAIMQMEAPNIDDYEIK
jgi:hypothetical protein